MFKKLIFTLPVVLVFFLTFTYPVSAFSVKTGESVNISGTDQLSGSLFVAGQTVTIQAPVPGDLYCAGQTVTVSAPVTGDVICAAQKLIIESPVAGSVRSASQFLDLRSGVSKNLSSVGQVLSISPVASVGGELAFAFQSVQLAGLIAKDTAGTAEKIDLSGQIGGTAHFNVSRLTLADTASVSGDLNYTSDRLADIASSTAVIGNIHRVQPDTSRPVFSSWQLTPLNHGLKIFGLIIKTFFYFLIGSLLLALFPRKIDQLILQLSAQPLKNFALGFLALILFPFVLFTLVITLIGIPLALLLMFVFILLMIGLRVLLNVWLGRKLIPASPYLSLFIGTLVSLIVFSLPIIGKLLLVILIPAFLGAFLFFLIPHPVKK